MDLATKSKSINTFTKLIVILLSVLTMFGAFECGLQVFDFADSYGDDTYQALKGEEINHMESYMVTTATSNAVSCLRELSKYGATEITIDEIDRIDKTLQDNEYSYNIYDALYINALKFYVVNTDTGTVLTNFYSDDDYKTVLTDNDYAFTVIDNVTTKTVSLSSDSYNYQMGKNIEGYFYFEVDKDGVYNGTASVDDSVGYNINVAYKLSKTNVRLYLILAVVLAILSVVLAVSSMILCGNRDRNGRVKLLFLDYVPVDIHFAISFALGALLVFGVLVSYEESQFGYADAYANIEFRQLWILVSSACAAGIQLVVIEFFTSFIRICQSKRKWYKTMFVTILGYALYKLVKIIRKRYKTKQEKIKETLSYKPKAFKKRIILFLTGYAIINLFLLLMGLIWYDEAQWNEMGVFFGVVNLLIFVALNITSVVFVTRYVINLDKIIVSMKNRTVPNVDYNKLPNSLKILVDSMQYTNQELANAVEKAVKDERMRTELITNVSHDLKTPLTSIINYVDLLKNCDIQDENANEYIAVLDEKGIKLKRLIEDLLEASKVTSGVINLNPVNLDLSELATQAVVEHQQEFVDSSLELVFKGDKQSIMTYADGNKTFRIIENLLSNARKYSAKGSRVYADVFEENNTAIFEIKNISAEPLDISAEELKERFVRGDKSRTNEGNGLGLSIADNLCKAMKGRLELIIDGDLFKARVILPKMK